MRIKITTKHGDQFRVCVVDDEGRTHRMFTYSTVMGARRAAEAWRVAYGDLRDRRHRVGDEEISGMILALILSFKLAAALLVSIFRTCQSPDLVAPHL